MENVNIDHAGSTKPVVPVPKTGSGAATPKGKSTEEGKGNEGVHGNTGEVERERGEGVTNPSWCSS
jgi:hypothetical protein